METVNGIPQCVTYNEYELYGYGNARRCSFSGLFSFAQNNGYAHADAMNIYVPWGSEFGGAANNVPGSKIILKVESLNAPANYHEMGHALGLRHTRSSNENTTRDPNNQHFNATIAGDRVVDTAANSGFYLPGIDPNTNYPYIDANCKYVGNETDNSPENVPYNIFLHDVANMMTDAYECDNSLITSGQGVRMRETIGIYQNLFNPLITDVASLYEPYAGEYYNAGPYDPLQYRPLFQPGFEYRFVECHCDCPTPSEYSDTTFSYNGSNILLNINKYETNYDNITHPNHTAIRIKHEMNGIVFFAEPRKCYDNFNREPSGGKVTKFNDNVFNTNVTITPTDGATINDPALITNLPSGLYEIEKQYDDGATQQTVIYKENN